MTSGEKKKLIAAHDKAATPKGKLKALAKLVRQHGEYMNHTLMGGWYTQQIIEFADQIDFIAETL